MATQAITISMDRCVAGDRSAASDLNFAVYRGHMRIDGAHVDDEVE
ncbi:MAG TPA: hypothetical protein VNG51_00785 [Ktedonobacteraceae bacterium]|nr:hypothetical protein [Ktedonobacteraceae bacterium]